MSEQSFLEAVFGGRFNDGVDVSCFEPDIERHLESVEQRYGQILRHRFALKAEFQTRERIAKWLPRRDGGIGVTTERVRQMEARALRRARVSLARLRNQIKGLQE